MAGRLAPPLCGAQSVVFLSLSGRPRGSCIRSYTKRGADHRDSLASDRARHCGVRVSRPGRPRPVRRRAGPESRSRLALRGTEVPADRPLPRRSRHGRGGRGRRAQHLLLRRRGRRPVEDHRCRHDLEAAVGRFPRGRRRRSARSRWRPPIRTSSMPARARPTSAATSPPATASINRPTPAKPGRTPGLRDTQVIGRIIVDPANSDVGLRRGARASVRRQPGARRLPLNRRRRELEEGALRRRQDRRRRTSPSIRPTPRSSTPACGRPIASPGSWRAAARAAASTSPPTAASTGRG